MHDDTRGFLVALAAMLALFVAVFLLGCVSAITTVAAIERAERVAGVAHGRPATSP